MTTFSPINTFKVIIPYSKNIRTADKPDEAEAKPDESTKPKDSDSK
ncbi:MAG TPA: hypothetical protein VLG47_01140 [Candidatus Saccharimonadales bacterium]|nr:hypothetical protein [Candidatus Saccharimonadales bacterium]